MLIIRLQRVGRKNDPSFRVIVTDSRRSGKTGSFIEIVGSYDARHGQPQFQAEKIKEWIGKGAQVSETVHNLLVKNKIIEGQTINTVPVKKAAPASPAEAPKAETQPAAASAPESSGEPKEETVAESEPVAPTEEASAPETPAEEPKAE